MAQNISKTEQIVAKPATVTGPRLLTLAQLAAGGTWQLDLAHDRPEALLIWITRGQGLALLDGRRRGVGTHNALFVPAGQLMSLDLGRQGYGQALVLPRDTGLPVPTAPMHIRTRDVMAQSELTTLFEALNREQLGGRAHRSEAMEAYATLALIWLQRQLAEHASDERDTASARLMRSYCQRVAAAHSSGETMAEYAAALGVTPTHLSRVCRTETGRTAAALLVERNLHAARQLLSTSDIPIREIAQRLGFGSAAYFTKFIQQHTGKPPSALRQASLRPA